MEIEDIVKEIKDAAWEVRRNLAPGFLEPVYQSALAEEFSRRGIPFVREYPIKVIYKGVEVGSYFADFIVRDKIIVELKAVEEIAPKHEAQLVNYLTATGFDDGLLINFGQKACFRKKTRVYHPINKENK